MANSKDEKRHYSMADAQMLQQSEVKQALFVQYEHRFISAFPKHLGSPYAEDWASANQAAAGVVPDYVSVASQKGTTRDVLANMKIGRAAYQKVIRYTAIAFDDDPTVLGLMGQPKYEKFRRNKAELPILLASAFNEASKPARLEVLIESRLKQADIDALVQSAALIGGKAILQEEAKGERSVYKDIRIHTLNIAYRKMAFVNECSKEVFKDEPTLLKLFVIYDSPSGHTPAADNTETPAS